MNEELKKMVSVAFNRALDKGDQLLSRKLAVAGGSGGAVATMEGLDPITKAVCLTIIALAYLYFNFRLELAGKPPLGGVSPDKAA